MKIFVKAKPGQRKESVERLDETRFVVSVKEKPRENEANFAIMEALAAHFHCAFSDIRLVMGRTSPNKVFEIPENRKM